MPPQSSKWDQYATDTAPAPSKWDKFAVSDRMTEAGAAANPPIASTPNLIAKAPTDPRHGAGTLGPVSALVPTPAALPVAGMVAGGALGSVEPGGGNIAGAALGGMAGEQARRLLQGQPTTSAPALVSTAQSGAAGATGEMGGQLVGKGLELGAGALRGTKGLLERVAGVPQAIAKEEGAAAATRAGDIAKFREVEQSTKEAQETAKARNISTYREAEQHLAAKQEEVAALNKADREAYQQAKKTAIDEQAKQQTIAARKANLAKASEQIKPAIQTHLSNVRDAVFDDLNKQWDTVRAAVGEDIKANPQSLTASAKSALDSVTEVNKDLFNKVLGNSFGGAQPTDLSWQEIQAAYTNLGKRLSQGGLPGDVWRSLKSFQDGLGSEMESMANAAGVKNEFLGVKKNWSQAMADWMDTSKPIAKGGSPLAHGLAKADPANVAKVFEGPLTGPASRALKILGRYQRYGADVGYPLRYRSILEEAETLPKPKGVKMPMEPTPRPTPEMTSAPYKPGPPDPNVAAYTPHPVDKAAIRAEQMSKLKKRAAVAALPIGGALGYETIHKLFGGTASVPGQ